ncbi:hypothetical protein [Coleofasciculus sp. H7-2]|uniref:hypothetical protein n=1 Tax=Coleofasciculus sp. H7-2 TaxID=3351545 RepID=UPI00366A7E5B
MPPYSQCITPDGADPVKISTFSVTILLALSSERTEERGKGDYFKIMYQIAQKPPGSQFICV